MSDHLDTTHVAGHDLYPVPAGEYVRERNPGWEHDEFVAYKCEKCGFRSEGPKRIIEFYMFRENPCEESGVRQ